MTSPLSASPFRTQQNACYVARASLTPTWAHLADSVLLSSKPPRALDTFLKQALARPIPRFSYRPYLGMDTALYTNPGLVAPRTKPPLYLSRRNSLICR
ncbi:hypothetical protein NUW54_g12518 [Trametes sanguinea]|uniref:Uncharacterized protein n=1 Tax=Trametes sanguinea TaxID=158606 RepID=A0ACC1MWK5_9APHY|nr:hypothetical protein NUW54_g12518 [Trametes sanguinea]